MHDKWQPMILNGCAEPACWPVRPDGGFRAIGVRGVPGGRCVPPGQHSLNGCAGRSQPGRLITRQRVRQEEAVGAPTDAS